MRKRGNGTDGLESPEIFRTQCGAHFPTHQVMHNITKIPTRLRHYFLNLKTRARSASRVNISPKNFLIKVSQKMILIIDAIYRQPQGGMYDPQSLKIAKGNKFRCALNDIYNIPLMKLKENEWISTYYMDKSQVLQEYVLSLSNAVYKIKACYQIE